jgi:hypothetical protein
VLSEVVVRAVGQYRAQALGSYTYAARLSASSCRSQLHNGFELVKIWATNSKSHFATSAYNPDL